MQEYLLEISFYLPESDEVFATLPRSIDDYWDWQAQASGILPYWGRYHWVLQTYLYLKLGGLSVNLTHRLPERGVIVTHLDCIDYGFRPTKDQLLIILLVDRDIPHPHAHLHITHNPVQCLPFRLKYKYVPPWPQIGLVPRDQDRGDTCRTVAYFGYANNLDPAITSDFFLAQLHNLGLTLKIPHPNSWHDFSSVDIILAIRNFGRQNSHITKPSLKLYNAWLAGVPAILGHESAYRHEGRVGINYMEATTPEVLLARLKELREKSEIRAEIAALGKAAAEEFSPVRTTERWRELIESTIKPLHRQFKMQASSRLRKTIVGPVLERVLWRMPGHFRELQ